MLDGEKREVQESDEYCLAYISNFQSLAPKMQEDNGPSIPVFAINERYLGTGQVLENYLEKRQIFYKVFSDMIDKVVNLTN